MQDKIILGLLSLKALTLYEIQKIAGEKIALFYNTSPGSIHPALKKLLLDECITVLEQIENGRTKKIYSITPKGKKTLHHWLAEPTEAGKIKDEAILKMFWFSEIDHGSALKVMSDYATNIETKIDELTTLKKEILQSISEAEKTPQGYFQLKTLEFGIDYYRFVNNWYSVFSKELIIKNGNENAY